MCTRRGGREGFPLGIGGIPLAVIYLRLQLGRAEAVDHRLGLAEAVVVVAAVRRPAGS